MGHSSIDSNRRTMVKIIILVCLATLAVAEADARYGYGYNSNWGNNCAMNYNKMNYNHMNTMNYNNMNAMNYNHMNTMNYNMNYNGFNMYRMPGFQQGQGYRQMPYMMNMNRMYNF